MDSSSDDEFDEAVDFQSSAYAQNEAIHRALESAGGSRDVNSNPGPARVGSPGSDPFATETTTVLRGDRARLSHAGRQSLLLSTDSKIPDYPQQLGNNFQSQPPMGRGANTGVRDVMHSRRHNGNGNGNGNGYAKTANPFNAPSPHDIPDDLEMFGNPAQALRQRSHKDKDRRPKKALPPMPATAVKQQDLNLPLNNIHGHHTHAVNEGKVADHRRVASAGGSGFHGRPPQGRQRLHSKDAAMASANAQTGPRVSRKRPSPSTNERRSPDSEILVDETTVRKLAKLHMQKRASQQRDSAQLRRENGEHPATATGAGGDAQQSTFAPFPNTFTVGASFPDDGAGPNPFTGGNFSNIGMGRGSSGSGSGTGNGNGIGNGNGNASSAGGSGSGSGAGPGPGGGSMFSAERRRRRRKQLRMGGGAGFGMKLSITNSNAKTPPSSPRNVAQETAAFETEAAAQAAAAAKNMSSSGGGDAGQKEKKGKKKLGRGSDDINYEIDAQGSLHVQGFELNESGIRRAPEKEGILQPFFLQTRLLRLDMLGRGASGSVYKVGVGCFFGHTYMLFSFFFFFFFFFFFW